MQGRDLSRATTLFHLPIAEKTSLSTSILLSDNGNSRQHLSKDRYCSSKTIFFVFPASFFTVTGLSTAFSNKYFSFLSFIAVNYSTHFLYCKENNLLCNFIKHIILYITINSFLIKSKMIYKFHSSL